MIMTIGMILLIFILIIYIVFHNTPLVNKTRAASEKRSAVKKQKKGRKKGKIGHSSVKLVACPTVSVKEPGETSYQDYPMENMKITIGSGSNADVRLEDDETVEKTHALLEKVVKGDQVYYELINLSKSNPVSHLNQTTAEYEYLSYKQGVVLEGREMFRIGESKVIVKIPAQHINISRTERQLMDENKKKQAEAEKMAEEEIISLPEEDEELPSEPTIRYEMKGKAEEELQKTKRIEK